MAMRTVYAVERGEYSDRRTLCLFTDAELATQYAKRLSETEAEADKRRWGYSDSEYYEWYDIVEYQLWDSVPVVELSRDGWVTKHDTPMPPDLE